MSNNTVYDIALIIKQVCKANNIKISLISITKIVGNGKPLYKNESDKLKTELYKLTKQDSIGIILSLFLGLRKGEVCGLQWNDIDIENKIIHIKRNISRVKCFDCNKKTKLIVSSPKTASSIRDLPLPEKIIPLLKNAKKDANNNYYILTNSEKFRDPRTYYNHYKQVLKVIAIDDHSYHELRYTFASNCIELGMDNKTLMELLGHSNITTTLNIYVQSSMTNKRKFINKL